MSSDGSVRRPRIRTDSERDRRRQNDRANYARVKIPLLKRNLACGTTSTNRGSLARDEVTDNEIVKLSTRDGFNEEQIAEKEFYLICFDVWNRFAMETKTSLLCTRH